MDISWANIDLLERVEPTGDATNPVNHIIDEFLPNSVVTTSIYNPSALIRR